MLFNSTPGSSTVLHLLLPLPLQGLCRPASHVTLPRCLNYVLEELKHNARAAVMVASHNEDTVRFTLCRLAPPPSRWALLGGQEAWAGSGFWGDICGTSWSGGFRAPRPLEAGWALCCSSQKAVCSYLGF